MPLYYRPRYERLTALKVGALALAMPFAVLASDLETKMNSHYEAWEADGMPSALLDQIRAGAEVYTESCAVCHGEMGEGGSGYPHSIVDTRGLDKFRTGQRLFIYNHGMMPFDDPGSLDRDAVWQVTAWLMAVNGWLDDLDSPLGPENARDVEIGP